MAKQLSFKIIALDFLRRLTSRKFLAPMIYLVVLILNYTQNWELPEELLSVVAGLLGIYEIVEGARDYKVATLAI